MPKLLKELNVNALAIAVYNLSKIYEQAKDKELRTYNKKIDEALYKFFLDLNTDSKKIQKLFKKLRTIELTTMGMPQLCEKYWQIKKGVWNTKDLERWLQEVFIPRLYRRGCSFTFTEQQILKILLKTLEEIKEPGGPAMAAADALGELLGFKYRKSRYLKAGAKMEVLSYRIHLKPRPKNISPHYSINDGLRLISDVQALLNDFFDVPYNIGEEISKNLIEKLDSAGFFVKNEGISAIAAHEQLIKDLEK